MVQSLFWKEKVVLKAGVALLWLTVSYSAFSQSPSHAQAITLSENGVRFHLVLEKLSKMTGLHFLYSSNKVDIHKTVFVNVTNQSLDHVLAVLGSQTNLSFTRKDAYVIVKPIAKGQVKTDLYSPLASNRIEKPNRVLPEQDPLGYSIPERRLLPSKGVDFTQPSSSYLSRNMPALQLYFDPTLLKGVAPEDLKKTNIHNRNAGLFVSAGLMVNDYSAGMEIQAGIRSAYVVFQPSLTKSKTYRGAYGIGTSIPMTHNFAFNPTYLYSDWSTETFFNSQRGEGVRHLQVTSRQHQMKLLFQYAFTDNLNMRIGPTLNHVSNSYLFKDDGIMKITYTVEHRTLTDPNGTQRAYVPVSIQQDVLFVKKQPTYSLQPFRVWVGWEATFSYKINFSQNP